MRYVKPNVEQVFVSVTAGKIWVANFPKKDYFLKQENHDKQENTYKARNDIGTATRQNLLAASIFSFHGRSADNKRKDPS